MQIIDGWYATNLGGLGPFLGLNDLIELTALQDLGPSSAGDLGHSVVGTTETIAIPYNVTFDVAEVGIAEATLSGQIVGTREITGGGPGPSPAPAPATIALLGLGLAGLGWSRRKSS